MGSGIGLKCNSCDYSEKFKLGYGMGYCPLLLQKDNRILRYVESKTEKASIAKLLKRGRVFHFKEEVNCIEIPERAKDYGYMLCRCPECNKMFSRFMFSIQTTDGYYSHTHLCPDCNCALEIIRPVSTAYDFSDCVCPVCKNRTLEAVPWLIKWD